MIGSNTLSREIIRTSLATILFSQIPFISLEKLDDFLEIVEVILLGRTDRTESINIADPASLASVEQPLGIVRDVDNSLVWKTVFAAVSDPNLIDYGRRYHCIVWYTRIYDEAKKKGLYAASRSPTSTVAPIKAKL